MRRYRIRSKRNRRRLAAEAAASRRIIQRRNACRKKGRRRWRKARHRWNIAQRVSATRRHVAAAAMASSWHAANSSVWHNACYVWLRRHFTLSRMSPAYLQADVAGAGRRRKWRHIRRPSLTTIFSSGMFILSTYRWRARRRPWRRRAASYAQTGLRPGGAACCDVAAALRMVKQALSRSHGEIDSGGNIIQQ